MIVTVHRLVVWEYLIGVSWSLAGCWDSSTNSGTVMFANGRGCRLALAQCVRRFGDNPLGWF